MDNENSIKTPPKGLAILAVVGPSLVWAAEFVGSGEIILSTRVGAILGPTVLWAIIVGVVLKFWIGMAGARYTVCTGEGMILTPFQALWVFLGLYVVMPKMLSTQANRILKPHWIFAVSLTAAFLVFGYFYVFQIPFVW